MDLSDNPALAWLHLLKMQLDAWHDKPSLRFVYRDYYKKIAGSLSPGLSLEIGGGIGRMKSAIPGLLLMDIVQTPWTDMACDAHRLAVKDQSLANIILFDVLHHLPEPLRFFSEAFRALRPGGRVILIEPYISPLSGLVYGWFHPEPFSLDIDPFAPQATVCGVDPHASNQAIATLLFHRYENEFRKRFPNLALIKRQRFAYAAYPATGGFGSRPLLPHRLICMLHRIESILQPLSALLAFRVMVVLEKRSEMT